MDGRGGLKGMKPGPTPQPAPSARMPRASQRSPQTAMATKLSSGNYELEEGEDSQIDQWREEHAWACKSREEEEEEEEEEG
jgi:hypothetical protein